MNSGAFLILTHYEVGVVFVDVSILFQVSNTLKSFSNMALGFLFINYQISKGLVHFYMQLLIDGRCGDLDTGVEHLLPWAPCSAVTVCVFIHLDSRFLEVRKLLGAVRYDQVHLET